MITPQKRANLGLNLGAKTTEEMASVGITTLAKLKKMGWEAAFKKLAEKYPERINLNMACSLIGAVLGKDWRDIPLENKAEAKVLIKLLKLRKKPSANKATIDHSFVEYIVLDQLASLNIHARRMFGAHGLYLDENFVAIIHDGMLFLKTSEQSRIKFIQAGMEPFKPTKKQTLKSYYQVPGEIIEDGEALRKWFLEAAIA